MVSIKVVMNVVRLNSEFDILESIHVRFPKNSLKILLPVDSTTVCKLSESVLIVIPEYFIALSINEYQVHATSE